MVLMIMPTMNLDRIGMVLSTALITDASHDVHVPPSPTGQAEHVLARARLRRAWSPEAGSTSTERSACWGQLVITVG